MRIHYNSPVIISFSLITTAVYLLNRLTAGSLTSFISLQGHFDFYSLRDYLTLFTYPFGHASTEHIIGNLSFILLIGPTLEEKYGSKNLILMMLSAALATGIANIVLFHQGLWGASGIVFMFIILISFANEQSGKIPLTFIFILILFVGKEVLDSFQRDNISQFAHIAGGIIGSIFGFAMKKKTKENF